MFKLDAEFVRMAAQRSVKMGFNGLGELVYYRTYSRIKANGDKESWHDTILRVVEGVFDIIKKHLLSLEKTWDEVWAQGAAQDMYDRAFSMKFLPAGRGLWAMGTDIINKKHLNASLCNCAFVSTVDMDKNPTEPFEFFMDMVCLGVGVGYDDKGKGKVLIQTPAKTQILADEVRSVIQTFLIPDTREGWIEALKLLLESYFLPGKVKVEFDYSVIRPAGEVLKTFGGISCGHGPLKEMLDNLGIILDKHTGKTITTRIINDVFCLIAKAVVSGNVRRSSSISLGSYEDEEFMNLKNYQLNPERMAYGWNSNNSIVIPTSVGNLKGDEEAEVVVAPVFYEKIAQRIADNGEPGIYFIDNARAYSRMNGSVPDWKDNDVVGVNPCGEQSLEDGELCNLVECFISRADDKADFLKTLQCAFLYAKSITLLPVHWPKTRKIMDKNRRIGTSLSGICDFLAVQAAKFSLSLTSGGETANIETAEELAVEELKVWMEQGYSHLKELDNTYSKWFEIPLSKKITSIKPSGTISLLAGIHYNFGKYYIRRVRISNTDPILKLLSASGYTVEPCVGNEMTTSVVEIPVACASVQEGADKVKTIRDVSIWDQFNLGVIAQRYWSDNCVSQTIEFKPREAKDIAAVLIKAQHCLKGISFLPSFDTSSDASDDASEAKTVTPYPQMPYERISKASYLAMHRLLKPVDYSKLNKSGHQDGQGDLYCDKESCTRT